jgi:hypothetical protein
MTTEVPPVLPWRWSDLPDPSDERCPDGDRCTLSLDENVLGHIAADHVWPQEPILEPWSDFLPAEVVQALRAGAEQGTWKTVARALLEQFLGMLGAALRQSLQQPRALLYRSQKMGSKTKADVWVLVLRCGAKLIVRPWGRERQVRTCFFPEDVCEALPSLRWALLCEALVRQCTIRGPGPHGRAPPPPDHKVPVAHPAEQRGGPLEREHRWRIRFVNLKEWGFAPEQDGCPWLGDFPDWRSATPGAGPGPVLAPRLGLDREESEHD